MPTNNLVYTELRPTMNLRLYFFFLFCSGWLLYTLPLHAQVNPTTNTAESNPFAQASKDTAQQKKKNNDWDETPARIQYTYYNSEVPYFFDSTLLFFHRNQYTQPVWFKDLGNWGTTAKNLVFTSNTRPGLTLGFNGWDMYKYTLDSLPFIHTTRPYTSFSFMVGSKQLQWVELMHTQNINPRWNFAFKIANNTSNGFFNLQRTSGFNGFFSTNYKSQNERLRTKFGIIFNNFKQDENGGITNDSFLTNPLYDNRLNVPVSLENQGLSATRSDVYNRQRDNLFFLENSYAWGKRDSLYNNDSTQVSYRFTPRFSIRHTISLAQTRHQFMDGSPDSLRYLFAGNYDFGVRDSVKSIQKWMSLDNKISLNTFIGKDSQQLKIEAGLGYRNDIFRTEYGLGLKDSPHDTFNTYVFGQISKEAMKPNQWAYQANASFFYIGAAAGNMHLSGSLSKRFSHIGQLSLGAVQAITNPAYNTTHFKTNFFELNHDFNKQTTTRIYGKLFIEHWKLDISLNNQLVANYIYLNSDLQFTQFSPVFSILQFSGRKRFSFGAFDLDNEVVWQQATNNAPVHVPKLMLRHQLSYKIPAFKGRLDAYLGIEGRYHTAYYADGYSPFYNLFYYQGNVLVNNRPELTAFFNFKVKRLRAFVMGDQLQQLFWTKNIMQAPGYPAPNVYLRFGFNWIMMN